MRSDATGRSWLQMLRPVRSEQPAQRPANPLLLDQVAAAAGQGAAAWAVETGYALCDRVGPERILGGHDVGIETPFVEAVALWAIFRLSGGKELPPPLEEHLRAMIRSIVESGLSSDVLPRCVRLVHAELAQALFRFCDSALPAVECSAEMQRISAELFDGMEALASFVAAEFAMQHARWLRDATRKRITLVNSILAEQQIDLKKATRQLGYDLTLHHVALLLRCDEHSVDSVSELRRTAVRFLEAVDCSSTLLVPAGPGRLWAWGGRATGRPVEFRRLARMPPVAPHIHVATGLPGDGFAGFRRSHVQAAAVERFRGTVEPPSAGWHDYGALELVLLLGGEIDAAAEFVARELGPLAAADRSTAALRETVLCYMDQERSVAATANLLYVAKNTVLYRVKRAEQLLGLSLREMGEDRIRFHIALYLAAKIGAAVLTDPRHEPQLVSMTGRWSA